ncbi:hypothetical protein [Kingella potus]|uniref:hypothetical protein n=1 Tax=Kingella potus TaxID=265175 RepID=UPI001FD08460|nr:hypothetical protein [Kingella potus]UOP00352.1 hypothetical protein LVJ84_10695 [Kingella potus]
MFAMSDPYTYILNCADGTVCAMLPDDPWQTWRTVSCGFGIFLRSMAASDIGRIRQHPTENLLREILAATQSTESGFWRDNVEGNW